MKHWRLFSLIFLVGLFLWLGRTRDHEETATGTLVKPALTVTEIAPTVTDLPLTIEANGTIAAWQEAFISAELTGVRLVDILVQVGDRVIKGQRLALYDRERVKADLDQSEALVGEAEATAQEAHANAIRVRQIIDEGALSALQAGQYLTGEKTAEARARAARSQRDIQKLRMRHTEVVANDDGTISSRSATLGAVTQEGQELFRLVRKDRLEWVAEVTASEISSVRQGIPVRIDVPDVGSLDGRVRMLGPTLDDESRYGRIYVELPEGAIERFKPGMFAHGQFLLGSSQGLTLPRSALVFRDGYSYVFKIHAIQDGVGRVEEVKVMIGRQAGDTLEILEGLGPEDRVVQSGAAFLAEGDKVRIVP